MRGIFFYLDFLLVAFARSMARFTTKRFLVLCERRDFFFGLSVVPRFAIELF